MEARQRSPKLKKDKGPAKDPRSYVVKKVVTKFKEVAELTPAKEGTFLNPMVPVKKQNTTKITRTSPRTYNYIMNNLQGDNKKQSALKAGYSMNMAHSAANIENTQSYAIVLKHILNDNTSKMVAVSAVVQRAIENGALDTLKVSELIDIQLKLAKIQQILTPQVTVKEEKLADGTVKKTVWGTGTAEVMQAQNTQNAQ